MKPFSAAMAMVLIGAACDDGGTTAPEIPGALFTVSGTVRDESDFPIPLGARVLVAWQVSSGSPDYSLVFGEGSLDRDAGAFQLGFFEAPPQEALNANGLGVGVLIVVDDPALGSGDRLEGDEDFAGVLGIAENHAVIYIEGDPAEIDSPSDWVGSFEEGFNVGRGIDLGGPFDGFEPVSPGEIVITLDDLEDLEFVDWT